MNNKALLDLLGDAGVQKEGSVICQGNKNKKKTKQTETNKQTNPNKTNQTPKVNEN